MESNFCFLSNDFPVLARFGESSEAYLYSDSNSCLMKLGMIGETIVNLMFTYDHISFPIDNTAAKRIDALYREGLLTRDLVDVLHALRKARNKAVHENYESVSDGKTLLQMAYSLCEWFMQTYGDWNYQNQPFVMPPETPEPVSRDKESEKAQEDRLIEDAEKTAAATPTIEKEARKKQSGKAASQRIKSEAETRYLIDEQLRKVGWEADTELVLLGTPLGGRTAKEGLQKVGLINHAGETLILISKRQDTDNPRLTVWEFDPSGIPLGEWEDKRARVETALNITIAKMTWGEGRKIVRVYAVPAECDFPALLRWEDKYLSPDSFVLVLGESLTGPVTVNVANIPHILLGGSTGSGKSELLKLLLCNHSRRGQKST